MASVLLLLALLCALPIQSDESLFIRAGGASWSTRELEQHAVRDASMQRSLRGERTQEDFEQAIADAVRRGWSPAAIARLLQPTNEAEAAARLAAAQQWGVREAVEVEDARAQQHAEQIERERWLAALQAVSSYRRPAHRREWPAAAPYLLLLFGAALGAVCLRTHRMGRLPLDGLGELLGGVLLSALLAAGVGFVLLDIAWMISSRDRLLGFETLALEVLALGGCALGAAFGARRAWVGARASSEPF